MPENKTKTYNLQINGISQSIKATKALKEILETVSGELEFWKKNDKFSLLFKDYATLTKGWTNNIEEVLPKLEVANKTLKTTSQLINEISAAIKIRQLKPVIENIENIEKSVEKYSEAEKYTEKAIEVYTEYYASLAILYKDDAKRLKEVSREKEKYDVGKDIYEKKYKEVKKEIKHLEDFKEQTDIEDVLRTKRTLAEKESLYAEHNNRIKSLQDNMVVSEQGKGFAGRGYTDIAATRKNFDDLQKMYADNIEYVRKQKDEVSKLYDEQLANYKGNTEGYLQLESEKRKKLADMDKQVAADQKAIIDNSTAYYNSVAKNIENMYAEFDKYYSKIGGLAKDFLDLGITELKDDLEKNKKILEEKTKAHTEHKNKVESLEKEAATASGGRAIVLQEQITREIAARDQSLQQQKEAEKEKEAIEKEVARKEKQKNKVEKVQQIAKATADQAAGVVKAWSMGPIVGPIMAAFVIASTAIQIAKLKREWDKLEDGGLLRGKRHSQGGMRIEGTNIEVEGDEFVVNRDSTRKNLGLIDYINRNRRELTPDDISSYYRRQSKGAEASARPTMKQIYEDGGMLTNLDMVESSNMRQVNSKILEAIENINFRPVVSVVEITDMQQSITSLKNTAGA